MSRRTPIAEADLHAYVDGELAAERKAAVDAHLARSPADAAQVAAWRAQAGLLHGVFDPVLAEPVPLRLSPSRLAERGSRRRPRLAGVAFLAFVAGAGCGGLAVVGLLSIDERPIRAMMTGHDLFAARVLAAHRTFASEVRHPVEVAAADEGHLVQWLSKRIDHPLPVPNLGGEGFALLGGRVIAGEDGPAALLMYENDRGERLTFYCLRAGKRGETSFRYAEDGGNAAVYWTEDKAAYAIVGPPDRERMMRLAERVYRALEERAQRS